MSQGHCWQTHHWHQASMNLLGRMAGWVAYPQPQDMLPLLPRPREGLMGRSRRLG